MSNVIKRFDRECEDCTVTPPAEIAIEGFRIFVRELEFDNLESQAASQAAPGVSR